MATTKIVIGISTASITITIACLLRLLAKSVAESVATRVPMEQMTHEEDLLEDPFIPFD